MRSSKRYACDAGSHKLAKAKQKAMVIEVERFCIDLAYACTFHKVQGRDGCMA